MLRPCTIFAVLVTLITLTPHASAQNISAVIGTPGTPAWGAACPLAPPPRIAPTGPSQLIACGGGPGCLHRTVIDTNAFPNAMCNDGTPGVFYVREGTGDDVDKWVIHVQGGGSCPDGQTCTARWCGQQGDLPYQANKMSTDWNRDGISDMLAHASASGMASMNPANNFRTWTHVWAYYCSSDSWMGRNNDVAFNGGVVPFTMHTRGHTILSAMRRMLRKNNAANPGWTAADGYSVPNLDNATDIIFSGTSAGAQGAITNVDWFLTPFTNANRFFVLDANNSALTRDTESHSTGSGQASSA